MIVYSSLSYTHFFQLAGNSLLSLLNSKTTEFLRIYKSVSLAEIFILFESLFRYINVSKVFIAVNNLNHINVVSNSIFKVSLVVRRNSHNSTCAVACKNEITDKHSYFLAVYRVNTSNTLQLTARLGLVKLCSVHIIFLESFFNISLNLVLVLNARHKLFHNISVRSKHHKSDTVNSFNTGCEN